MHMTTSSLAPFSLDQWYNVATTLDYASQTYSIAVDGAVVGSDIPFCGHSPNSNSCTGAQSSQFEGIELSNAIIKSGAIYFGNVSISAVPEPASWTMMLAGFAVAGLTLRSRRSALAA